MDVTDSDHKPVRCILSVELARVDEAKRRKLFGEIIKSNEKIRRILEEQCNVPDAILSTNNIILHDNDKSILRITNKCGEDKALFRVICEGQCTIKDGKQASSHRPRGCYGFPRWLAVIFSYASLYFTFILFLGLYNSDLLCTALNKPGDANSWYNRTKSYRGDISASPRI